MVGALEHFIGPWGDRVSEAGTSSDGRAPYPSTTYTPGRRPAGAQATGSNIGAVPADPSIAPGAGGGLPLLAPGGHAVQRLADGPAGGLLGGQGASRPSAGAGPVSPGAAQPLLARRSSGHGSDEPTAGSEPAVLVGQRRPDLFVERTAWPAAGDTGSPSGAGARHRPTRSQAGRAGPAQPQHPPSRRWARSPCRQMWASRGCGPPARPGFSIRGQFDPGQFDPGQVSPGQVSPGQVSLGRFNPVEDPPTVARATLGTSDGAHLALTVAQRVEHRPQPPAMATPGQLSVLLGPAPSPVAPSPVAPSPVAPSIVPSVPASSPEWSPPVQRAPEPTVPEAAAPMATSPEPASPVPARARRPLARSPPAHRAPEVGSRLIKHPRATTS